MMVLKSVCYLILTSLLGVTCLVGTALYTNLTPKEVAVSKLTENLKQQVDIKFKIPKVDIAINNKSYSEKPANKVSVKRKATPKTVIKKSKKTNVIKAPVIEGIVDTSSINNEELVKHYGFVASLPKTIDLIKYYEQAGVMATLVALNNRFPETTKVAALKEEKLDTEVRNIEDTVVEVKSSQLKEDTADEMVFFDLTKERTVKTEVNNNAAIEIEDTQKKTKEKTTHKIPTLVAKKAVSKFSQMAAVIPRIDISKVSTPKIADANPNAHISDRVKRVIKRIQSNKPHKKKVKSTAGVTRGVSAILSDANLKYDYSTLALENKEININAYSIDMGGKHPEKVSNFQFVPNYDESEVISSDADGIMNIQLRGGELGAIRGRFIAMGHIRVVADIPIGSVDNLEVPLIDEGMFNSYVDGLIREQSVPEDIMYGGHVLAYVEESVEDISIDREYKAKILLNDNFSVVKDDSYSYVMFLGVDPGNVVVSYLYGNGEVADKVSYVPYDEVLFEFGITD